jgi:hypothetical protein
MEYCQDGRYKIGRPPVWVATGKYRAKSGKYIAVANTSSLSAAQKAALYTDKASNLLWVNNTNEADTLSQSPYNIPKSQMIIGVSKDSNLTPLVQAGLKRFSLDEPVRNGATHEQVSALDTAVPTDGRLYLSEINQWMDDDRVSAMLSIYAPYVSSKSKFGTHTKWEDLDGYGNVTDPRPQWTQIKNDVGSEGKFEHGTVKTIKEVFYIWGSSIQLATTNEMQLIWGHANNLGANTIFIYVEGSDIQYHSDVLNNALNAGFQAGGWLEREEEEITAVYCCTTQSYDPESCTLLEILHPGNFRWV